MDNQYSLFSDTENKEKNKFAIGHPSVPMKVRHLPLEKLV